MHPRETVDRVAELAAQGLSATAVARRLALPRTTVRDWMAGKTLTSCSYELDMPPAHAVQLPDNYVYLLGLYLGDGCLSPHPRGVFRLRIALDGLYPGIIEECAEAIREVRPGATVNVRARPENRAVDVSAY